MARIYKTCKTILKAGDFGLIKVFIAGAASWPQSLENLVLGKLEEDGFPSNVLVDEPEGAPNGLDDCSRLGAEMLVA